MKERIDTDGRVEKALGVEKKSQTTGGGIVAAGGVDIERGNTIGPECNEQRLRLPMVILNRLAQVPRTCITNAITSLAKTAGHAPPAPKLSKPLLRN